MRETILFHHIPKTAGTTLLDIVGSLYPRERTYVIDGIETDRDIDRYRGMNDEEKSAYPVIIGHQAMMLYDSIPGEKKVIAFFRDPYEQFLSSYYYLRRATHNRKHHQRVKSLALPEFLRYSIDNHLTNPQAKTLFAAHYEDETDEQVVASKSAAAFDRLTLPCITEEFDLSLMLLKRTLGWHRWPLYSRKNASKKEHYAFDQALFDWHREHNQADYAVYDRARRAFDELTGDPDRAAAARFSRRNTAYGYLRKLRLVSR